MLTPSSQRTLLIKSYVSMFITVDIPDINYLEICLNSRFLRFQSKVEWVRCFGPGVGKQSQRGHVVVTAHLLTAGKLSQGGVSTRYAIQTGPW